MEFICAYSVIPTAIISFIRYKIRDYLNCTNERVIIELRDGKIEGIKRRTIYDSSYYSFEDIPYGKPPICELRFRAPQPVEPWTGVRDCTKGYRKPMQLQFPTIFPTGSEDCLYLNVYVAKFESIKPLPVIVFIPGGGFIIGEASRLLYSADYFMEKDVILVVINYRVGPFGFLSLKDPKLKVPGNAGIRDQILALKWIKTNITQLNGDPGNITVMGQSAGSLTANHLMSIKQCKDLFHKAVLMSGTALCYWATYPPNNIVWRLALKLGYNGENIDKDILEFLLKIDARWITFYTNFLINDTDRREFNWMMSFGPCIEPYENEDTLINKSSLEMLKSSWGNKIPIILGHTSFEGLFFYQLLKKHKFFLNNLNDCEVMVPNELRATKSAAEVKKIALSIKQTYFGNVDINFEDHFFEFLDLMSCKIIMHGVYRTIRARQKYARNEATYLYRFNFDSLTHNHTRKIICGLEMRGTAHTDDLSYLFYNCCSSKLSRSSAEYATIQRFVAMISSFAESSNPNCDAIRPTVWEPLADKSVNVKCLNIDNKLEMIELPGKHKFELWSKIFALYQEL